MAIKLTIYPQAALYTKDGTINLESANIKLALLTKDYTPNMNAHSVWDDLSPGDNEVADGNGYQSGGAALPDPDLSRDGNIVTWSAGNVTFTALTKIFKYGAIYLNQTVNGVVKPLIALIDFDDSGPTAEISVTDTAYTIEWHTDGIWEFGPAADICT